MTSPLRGLLFLCCGCTLAGALGVSSWASVGVTPMLVEVNAEPGGPEESFELHLINMSETRRAVTLTTEGFLVTDYGDLVFESQLGDREDGATLADKLQRYSGAAYIRVPEDPVELMPGEQRTVRCGLRIPASQRGERYAFVVADAGPSRPTRATGTPHELRVTLQVGVAVFIVPSRRVPGSDGGEPSWEPMDPPRYEAAVTAVEVRVPAREDDRQALRVNAVLENRSNVHVFPEVSAEIRRIEGGSGLSRPQDVSLDRGSPLLFPKSVRRYAGEVLTPVEPGRYQLRVSVEGQNGDVKDSRITEFQVLQRIKGVTARDAGVSPLAVTPAEVRLVGQRGNVTRQTAEVRSLVADPIAVSAAIVGDGAVADMLYVSPTRFVLPPMAARVLTVRASVDESVVTGTYTASLLLTASTLDGQPVGVTSIPPLPLSVLVLDDGGADRR